MKYLYLVAMVVMTGLITFASIAVAESNKKEKDKLVKDADVMVTLVDQLQKENKQLKLDLAKTRMAMQLDNKVCGASLQASRDFLANLNFAVEGGGK